MYVMYITVKESLLNIINTFLRTEKIHLFSLYKKYKKMFFKLKVNELLLYRVQNYKIILKDR